MKNVVFDIGNVLVDFDWKAYLDSLFDSEEAKDVIGMAFWKYEIWREMDRGALSRETIRRSLLDVAGLYGYEKEMEIAYNGLGGCIKAFDKPFDYAKPWILSLKEKGYSVYFLSNYSEYLIEQNPEPLSFREVMDGGIFSCDVKLLKPDLAIYKVLCDRYHLEPSECLFIDDKPINIIAAKEYGMHGIVFEGYEKTYPVVMEYLEKHRLD